MLTHSTILGYPRIGPRRELKRALEAYWDGRLGRDELDRVGAGLRADLLGRIREQNITGCCGSEKSISRCFAHSVPLRLH